MYKTYLVFIFVACQSCLHASSEGEIGNQSGEIAPAISLPTLIVQSLSNNPEFQDAIQEIAEQAKNGAQVDTTRIEKLIAGEIDKAVKPEVAKLEAEVAKVNTAMLDTINELQPHISYLKEQSAQLNEKNAQLEALVHQQTTLTTQITESIKSLAITAFCAGGTLGAVITYLIMRE